MRLQHTLTCLFLFSAVMKGSTALFEKDIGVRTGTEGGTITIKCSFSFSGDRKVFCRGECEDNHRDILVETYGNGNQRGRYNFRYEEGTYPSSYSLIHVSITNLKKSDSGKYKCWLIRDLSPDSYETFELRVTDAPSTSKPRLTSRRSSSSTSTLSPTLTRSTTLKTSPNVSNGTAPQPSASGQGPLLYLCLLLVLLIVMFSVILLIYCKKRNRKPKAVATGPPVKTEYAEVSETNQIYEEIGDDHPNKSPPRNISTIYTCAKFSKQHEASNTDEYSLAGPQIEDDSKKLAYSTVDFSNCPAASHKSAPSEGVIYSTPRRDASSEDALYSNVTLH